MRSSLWHDWLLCLGSKEPGGMLKQVGRWCWVPRSPAHLGSFWSQKLPRSHMDPSTNGQPCSCPSPAHSPAG